MLDDVAVDAPVEAVEALTGVAEVVRVGMAGEDVGMWR